MRFLANTPILVKALFIVAVPLLMLSLFMLDDLEQARLEEQSMQTLLQATDFSDAAASLVGELQRERGMSAGFLGSSGKQFSGSLKRQQDAVNQGFSDFQGSIVKNSALIHASPALQSISAHVIQEMKRLNRIRQQVRSLDITVVDELAYYTDMVDDLMQVFYTVRNMYSFGADAHKQTGRLPVVPNAKFSGLLTSLIVISRASEAAGVERAVLANTFALGRFDPHMYEHFIGLVALQQSTLHDFLRQSPASIGRMFSSIYAGKAVDGVKRVRDIAMQQAGTGAFGVDSEQWFRIASKRIALLGRVERNIITLIRQHSYQGQEQADNRIRNMFIRLFVSILFAAGLSMWAACRLLLGIRRASQTVQAIESGAYDVPVIVRGGDEVGQMLASVERMRLSLMAAEQARMQQQKTADARLKALLATKDELHRSRDFIERILASMPSMLIAVDDQGHITFWNDIAASTFGLSSEAVTGTPFFSCPITWDWQTIKRSMAESEALYTCSLDHVAFKRADGTEGFLWLSINAVLEDGQSNGFLLIGLDITARIQLENQLQMAQKMESMGVLAAGIAHEINTPMQYIGDNVRFLEDSFAELLALVSNYHQALQSLDRNRVIAEQRLSDIRQAEADTDLDFLREEVPMAVAQTLDGVAHVSKIVAAMKELSHPGTAEKTAIDINKTIENTVTVSRNEWKYVADLEMNLDPDLPMIHALPEIHQVFLNIIVNAAHAIEAAQPEGSDKKGRICIVSARIHNRVEIRISDSGPGIDKQVQDKIFDPFFTTKAPGKGTGQGLAISHQIVCKRLGGRLFVESEAGQGATFVIQLPLS